MILEVIFVEELFLKLLLNGFWDFCVGVCWDGFGDCIWGGNWNWIGFWVWIDDDGGWWIGRKKY